MLADAGALTLDLQLRLLQSGFALKDASAYNVQFVAGRPQWIDLGSIERPPRPDLWYALGQFSQMFTFPLLLCRRAGWDLRSYFLANIGGLDVRAWRRVRNAGPLAAVAAAGRRPAGAADPPGPAGGGHAGLGPRRRRFPRGNSAGQIVNLKRLRRKIARLAAGYRPRGEWSRYEENCSYSEPRERPSSPPSSVFGADAAGPGARPRLQHRPIQPVGRPAGGRSPRR